MIDATAVQSFRVRMSDRPPADTTEEQAWDERARRFHAAAALIEDMGDGVRAYTGLVAALLSLPDRILLVDEPEAFLHPTLARRLGTELARLARQRGASLVTATHSADFLIGCLEAVGDTSVVRLEYQSGEAVARALAASDLETMTSDPLLRSTGLLRGLFHRAVVVAESDADRAFYDEINRRLVTAHRGISDALFLNAQNKQTVQRLVGPLRNLGIPAAAVVDLDLLRDQARDWKPILDACQVPSTRHASIEGERLHLANAFNAIPPLQGALPIKSDGIAALMPGDQARANALLGELARYGLFLVPCGELECWLKHLGVMGHGPEWLIRMFGRIGQSETDVNYIRPTAGDVWDFLDSLAAWTNNPLRLGT